MKTISRDELKQKIDRKDDFLLVETLSATVYHHSHLPGAINLPPEKLKDSASQILPDKNAEIVVYCANPACQASENAARELTALGYTNVRDYAEGKQDWIDAGLTVETDDKHIGENSN